MAQLQVLRERREKQAAAKAAGLDLTMTETGEASKDTMGTTPGPNATGPFSETKDVTMHGTSNHPKSSPTGSGMGHKEVEGERISSQISFPSSSQSQTSTPPSFTPGAAPSLASIIAQTVSKPKRPPVAPPPEPEKPKTEKLTDHYHIFLDRSGFEYNISLIRTNLVRSCSAKYTIRLFESHTQPHTYCTYVRYAPMPKDAIPKTLANGIPIIEDFNKTKEKGKGKGKTIHPKMASAMAKMGQTPQPPEGEPTDRTNEPFSDLLAPTGSDYASAFTKFCTAFQELTFLTWEERLHSNVRKMQKSRARYLGLEPFVYAQPKIGLPKGVAPSIRLPPMKQEDLRKQTLQLPGMDVKINEEYSVGRVVVREEEQAKKIREEREEQIKESNRVNNKRKSKSSGSLRPDRRAKVVFTPTPSSNPNPNAPLFPASPRPRTTGTARGFGSNEAGMLIGMEMVNRDRNGMCHFRREED
jgi:hypothetical protein